MKNSRPSDMIPQDSNYKQRAIFLDALLEMELSASERLKIVKKYMNGRTDEEKEQIAEKLIRELQETGKIE